MSFEYIEEQYGLRFRPGQIVRAKGKLGRIVDADGFLRIRIVGRFFTEVFNPYDVEPVDGEGGEG
jgi:hypothetical protein